MSLRCYSSLLLILAIAPISVAQEPEVEVAKQTYPIKLHRPAVKGEAYSYAAVGRLVEKISVTVDGETTESKDAAYRCELASRVEVLEVDENGLPTELMIKVYRFQKQGDEGVKLLHAIQDVYLCNDITIA